MASGLARTEPRPALAVRAKHPPIGTPGSMGVLGVIPFSASTAHRRNSSAARRPGGPPTDVPTRPKMSARIFADIPGHRLIFTSIRG